MKRLVVISDLHCGHKTGLTHPDFEPGGYIDGSPGHKLSLLRRECWRWYSNKVAELQPVDILVVNGDAIDGRGEKSGGTEQLVVDRNEQCDMAKAAIEICKAGVIRMTYGTPYHTGDKEDYEGNIAKALGAFCKDLVSIDVNGLVFDIRHHIGGSQSPTNRTSAITREALWNLLWAERKERPKADVIVRSHVHYFTYAGDSDWLGVVTPALQAIGGKYGGRRMSGTVDFGIVSFDIESRDEWSWRPHALRPRKSRIVAEKL
jgi:hypothetical protein